MKTIYVDNNSTTMVSKEVMQDIIPYYEEHYANPSSSHTLGLRVKEKLNQARISVARLINADPEEIYFTSGGTEANNWAIQGSIYIKKDTDEIIISSVEHHAVLKKCDDLQSKGFSLKKIPVDKKGNLDLLYLKESISSSTSLISIMHANNETGVIFPVEEIALIAKKNTIPFHIDGVQAAGKIDIDVKKIGCDLYAISSHKFHGPKGIGALYIRKGFDLKPLFLGGNQEHDMRPGTENVTGIIGMGKASEIAKLNNGAVEVIRNSFEDKMIKHFSNIIINGKESNRVPNTSSISFKDLDAFSVLHHLEKNGIFASNGAACSSGSIDPSHVVRAMKISSNYAYGTIRFSFSKYNSLEDIDVIINALSNIVK